MTGLSSLHSWSAASPYALALGLAALVCVVIAVQGWRHRVRPGGLPIALMMAAAAAWALFYAFEITAPSQSAAVVWAKAEYLGIATIPLTWFLFARRYTGAKRIRRVPLLVLALIPAATMALAATNELHHLLWSRVGLDTSGGFSILDLAHGPWFWVFTVYSYSLLLAGSAILVSTVVRYPQLYRRQAGMLMVAMVAPWVGNAVTVFHLFSHPRVDVTPFAFAVSGIALFFALSRFRFFDLLPGLLPAARNQVLQKMKDGVMVLDADGRVVGVNPAAGRMLGEPESSLKGRQATEVLGHQLGLPGGDGSDSQFEVSLGEGVSARSYDIVSSALGFEGGMDAGRLLVLRDITERKQMEARLIQSEEQFRALIDNAADLVSVIDATGTIRFQSPSSESILGYSPEELVGRSIFAFLPEAGIADAKDRLGKFAAEDRDEPDSTEITFRHKDGSLRVLEVKAHRLADSPGGRSFVLNSRDTTERRRIEESLRDRERRYRMLFESANDGIIVHGLDGTILEANRVMAERVGLDRDELLGLNVEEIRASEPGRPFVEQVQAIVNKGSLIFETKHRGVDSQTVPVEVSSRLLDTEGPAAILSISRDITERRRSEEALAAAEGQLRQAQKMEAVGQLAGGIAHDFNNLLTAIIGNSELVLAATAAEDPNRELVEDVKSVGERAAALTRQILAFSRRQMLKPEILCANDAIGQIQPLLARTLGEDIHLQVLLTPELCYTEVDPSQLEQVLMNLAVNARDAMPQGGELIIETANVELDRSYCMIRPELKPGRHVMLAVSDSGCGMDEETKTRIFEPFFTTKEVGKGTGLGLSTVFGIVKQSGGSISVYSELGRGTTFKIYLPVHRGATGHANEVVARQEAKKGEETILVVEDEAPVRRLVYRVLSRSGYTVLQAGSGPEAEALLAGSLPELDLLLTDVVLPGGRDGHQVAEQVHQCHPNLPVLFMSGYTQDSAVFNGSLGADADFLAKPFTTDGLLAKVREVLDDHSPMSAPAAPSRW